MFVVSQILALFTTLILDKEKNVTKPLFIFELVHKVLQVHIFWHYQNCPW